MYCENISKIGSEILLYAVVRDFPKPVSARIYFFLGLKDIFIFSHLIKYAKSRLQMHISKMHINLLELIFKNLII
jgi:hypothetical protein